MITENGGIKSSAKYDENLFSQINRTNFICCIIVLCVGAVGLIFSVVLHFIAPDSDDIFMIVCFSVLTAAGLFLLIMTRVNIKKGARAGKSNVTEVYSDHFIAIEYVNGQQIGEVKVYFKTLYKCKESKDYFFAYVSRNAVHPIGKEGLTPAERATIRKVMGLPQRTELITQTVVPAEARKPEAAAEQPSPAVTKGEVFEEFPDIKEDNQ